MRLLLVEDNHTLAEWLRKALQRQSYTVDWLDNGADADYLLGNERYDLIVLDLALPKMDGHEVLRRLRARNDATPVLILTADNSMRRRVTELDLGADDYMAKPFELEELEARVRVLLRRAARVANPQLRCGDLQLDTNTKIFTLAGSELTLTPRERAVLEVLITRVGRTVSKQELLQSLVSIDAEVSADAMEIYVHRLRRKLEPSTQVRIVTLRGLGYLLRDAESC